MGTKRAASHTTRRKPRRQRIQYVHQFLIALSNTDPLVWRRIQVPEDYSFWDLHVAIQDSLGWQDYHLHEFTVLHPDREQLERIGIPDEDFPEERPCVPSWQVRVSEYFAEGRPPALYLYDFGDNWQHVLMYEGAWPADPSVAYPRCVAGARACPPEDCGGVHGYADFLAAVTNPRHPEHVELLQWAGGGFDPDAFEPTQIVFDDPQQRWKQAFEE